MKSYSSSGKKNKVHFKANVSSKLSDSQLLEKFGIKKCFVELDRVKSDEYGLSEITSSSSSQKAQKSGKNKLQKSNPKHREKDKKNNLDCKIIKNGAHHQSLEDADHSQLPPKNHKTLNISAKNKVRRHAVSSQQFPPRFSEGHVFEIQEQIDDSNPSNVDLARRITRSSSNSRSETQNSDSEFAEVLPTNHETPKEVKLTNREKRRNNRTGSSTNSNKEILNPVSEFSETILKSHQQEEKKGLKQVKRKKKTRTSINSNKKVPNMDSEEAVFSSHEQVEESNLTETDLTRKNITRRSSDLSRGTQNFESEHLEQMLVDHSQADKTIQVEIQKRKQKRNKSSSNSNRVTQNLDSEATFSGHEGAEKGSEIQIGRRKRNKLLSNPSGEVHSFSSESSDAVLSSHEQEAESKLTKSDLSVKNRTRSSSNTSKEILNLSSVCSEEKIPDLGHSKKVIKVNTRKSRRKKSNTSSSVPNRETQNLDSESSETTHADSELVGESGLTETDFSKKKRTRSSSISNSRAQSIDSGCAESALADDEHTETTKTHLSRKNRTRSSSTSSGKSQNFESECSETVLSRHKQTEESNITEIDLSQKIRTGNSSNSITETQNLKSVSTETVLDRNEQGEESNTTEIDLSRKNITRSSSNSSIETQNLKSASSETVLDQYEQGDESNLTEIDLSSKNRSRSSSTSSGVSQNFNSECSETVLSHHEKTEESNITEIDLSLKNRIRSSSNSSTETQNFNSAGPEQVQHDHEQSEVRQVKTRRKSPRSLSNSNKRTSNLVSESSDSKSSIETQNLNSVYPEQVLHDHEQSEVIQVKATRKKLPISLASSSKRTSNLDSESSEMSPVSHDQAQQISLVQTRSRKRNRSPSNSSRETLNFDAECSDTVIVNHESSLIKTDLMESRNRNSSSSSRATENSVSEYSETLLANSEQLEEMCQTSTGVRRGRTRSPSISSDGTQSLSSDHSGTIYASSEQAEESSLTETDLSGKKKSRRSSDSSREIQNLDSEFSGEADSHTDEWSSNLISQTNLPASKKARNSTSSNNWLPEVQNSSSEEKNNEQFLKTQKPKKKLINHEKNSILFSPRITRNSSNLSKNKNFHSILSNELTSHLQTQKINPNLLAKRSRSTMSQISHFECNKEHTPEQTQDVFLDSNLPVKKKAKKCFNLSNSFQNSNSESSETSDEILQMQELILDPNSSDKTGSRALNSKVHTSDFSENHLEHMQTNESNQRVEDLEVKGCKTTSDLDSKVTESVLKFTTQNGIEDDLEKPDGTENSLSLNLNTQEKIEADCSSYEKANASDSENKCVEDYPLIKEKQPFSTTSDSLDNKFKNFSSGNLEMEHESTSVTRARTCSCSSDRSNLSDSEILKSNSIDKSMGMETDFLGKQRKCSENNVAVQFTTVRETCVENDNSESESDQISESDDPEKKSDNQEKPLETLDKMINFETLSQCRCRTDSNSSCKTFDSNFKHLESVDDEDVFCDIENSEISEEDSDFSDAALCKKYGIKPCSVILERPKPFTIHYGRPFLREVIQHACRSARVTNVVNLDELCKTTRLSQFSSRETFKQIVEGIRRFNLRQELIRTRLELIDIDEAQVPLNKKKLRLSKVFYDNTFVIVDREISNEVNKVLRNRRMPLVRLEKNEEAEYLSRKLLESKGVNLKQNKNEKFLNQQPSYRDYREMDQHFEVDESENEYDKTYPDTDYGDNDSLTSNPEEMQNVDGSNLGCKESPEKEPLILDNQQDLETGVTQNLEDNSNCVNSKLCENQQRVQNEIPLDWNPTTEPLQQCQWPQVVLHPLKRTVEKDHGKSSFVELSELDHVPFEQRGYSERADVHKDVIRNESASDYNPPSPGREMESEKESCGGGSEEFVVIDEDDDDFVADSQGSHQNSSLCPS